MKKIAVFGKPGSGKSRLSKRLSETTSIKLYQLDLIAYDQNGKKIEREQYDKEHEKILALDSWIIDGLGPLTSFYTRLSEADTLIYIDLPYPISYWLVTKRLIKGLWTKPEGWPESSSILKGTMNSYKILRLCPQFWNDDFVNRLEDYASNKKVVIIRSISQLNSLNVNDLKNS